jgi:hypothetical protein
MRLPAWPTRQAACEQHQQRVAPAFGFYDDGRWCPLMMQEAAVKSCEAALREARSRERRLLQGIRGIGDEPEIAQGWR